MEKSPDGRFERLNDEINTQAFKTVYRGIDTENGNEVAWNIMKVTNIPKNEKLKLKSEFNLIKKLQHDNIIHTEKTWYNSKKQEVHLITEMITGGSLRNYLRKFHAPKLQVIKK